MKSLLLILGWICGFHYGCQFSQAMAVDELPRKYLIFGGNGMLGSATVERMIPGLQEVDKLVVVNRGNWYWNTAFTIKPHVTHIKCDRQKMLANCPDLIDYVTSAPYINAIIDFTAYHPNNIQESLELLQGKAKLYIYISSDSIYEVCNKTHDNFTQEEDAIRPETQEEQDGLNERDYYGHQKLQCEEVLTEHRNEKNGPPFITLRLPDVIGPRDNSYRWWVYQLWMKLNSYLEKPLSIPTSIADNKMSLVYSNDVADLIVRILGNDSNKSLDEVIDQAFNVAQLETPTLRELLNDMMRELNLTDVKIEEDDRAEAPRIFPSVRLGPINASKAEQILNWQPMPWTSVVAETVKFYETAIKEVHYSDAKTRIIQTMQSHFTSKPNEVINGLQDIYNLHFARRKDEL